MDVMERIAGFPEWGDPDAAEFDDEAAMALRDSLTAALARLALYNELAKVGDVRLVRHADWCDGSMVHAGTAYSCSCGRDALLAALEVPK